MQQDDLAFWDDLMTLREPPYRAPADDELIHLQDQVAKAAHDLAACISARAAAFRADQQETPPAIALAPDWQLACLYALRQIDAAVRQLSDRAARSAGALGAGYPQLGAAWGITRQAARLRWPGAVPSNADTSGEADSVQLQLDGGIAEIIQLPDGAGFVWAATGADGATGQAEEPYGSRTQAAAHAGVFLSQHAVFEADFSHDAAHADCSETHRGSDGYVDCDGKPL